MAQQDKTFDCAQICWIVAGIAGAVFLVVLEMTTHIRFMWAVLFGIAVFVVGGMILRNFFCGAEAVNVLPTVVEAPAPAPTPAPKPAAAASPVVAAPTAAPKPAAAASPAAAPTAAPKPAAANKPNAGKNRGANAGKGGVAKPAGPAKPEMLTDARGGKGDDLKQIKGVGPKLMANLNAMGVYHFDQIAGWSADEIAWVDENLEGFKGRVSRDDWVAQAKVLAAGGTTEFSTRVKKGGVY